MLELIRTLKSPGFPRPAVSNVAHFSRRGVAEGFGLLAYVGNFSFERAAAVAQDNGAVALEAYKVIAGCLIFGEKAVFEFIADGAKKGLEVL